VLQQFQNYWDVTTRSNELATLARTEAFARCAKDEWMNGVAALKLSRFLAPDVRLPWRTGVCQTAMHITKKM